jgi:hypothetical protein
LCSGCFVAAYHELDREIAEAGLRTRSHQDAAKACGVSVPRPPFHALTRSRSHAGFVSDMFLVFQKSHRTHLLDCIKITIHKNLLKTDFGCVKFILFPIYALSKIIAIP